MQPALLPVELSERILATASRFGGWTTACIGYTGREESPGSVGQGAG